AQFEVIDGLETVQHFSPVGLVALDIQTDRAEARLEDGSLITANLVIGADGRGSFVRDAAGIDCVRWTYGQKAVVFSIAHEFPHEGLALEHFKTGGPFAVLPLLDDDQGRHRSSVVWSERSAQADRLVGLDEPAFNAALQRCMGDYLGKVALVGRRFLYPLGAVHANDYAAERVALINEAAHGIHPIAGQGLNVGLRDVDLLADLLIEGAGLGMDLGTYRLEDYSRRRRADVLGMLAATDGLNRLFSTGFPPVQLARDLGLAVVGRVPPLKRFFMRQAMGLGRTG
ncbi:MAG: FAD-dependent monooxygenase, partial [Pseudomonadota bacterium]